MDYNTKQKVIRRLNKAADYMEEHGYCKGTEMDSRGRVCAYGAINEVMKKDGSGLREEVSYAFSDYLVENHPRAVGTERGNYAIFSFNDVRRRRGKDVVRALRACAKDLKAPKKD